MPTTNMMYDWLPCSGEAEGPGATCPLRPEHMGCRAGGFACAAAQLAAELEV